jgi:hypothetical protein
VFKDRQLIWEPEPTTNHENKNQIIKLITEEEYCITNNARKEYVIQTPPHDRCEVQEYHVYQHDIAAEISSWLTYSWCLERIGIKHKKTGYNNLSLKMANIPYRNNMRSTCTKLPHIIISFFAERSRYL